MILLNFLIIAHVRSEPLQLLIDGQKSKHDELDQIYVGDLRFQN